MDKDLLRKKNMNIRDSLDASEVEMLSHKICERLRQLDEYKKSDVFLMFYPKGNEVRLNELFTENEVYLPKTVRKDMTFHRYTGEEDLVKARFGIMEPSSLEVPDYDKNIFMIIPGLCFDRSGGRVVYGGVFYDRFLEKYKDKNIFKAAVAFDFQIISEDIPTEEFDIKPDMIVTESEVIMIGKSCI